MPRAGSSTPATGRKINPYEHRCQISGNIPSGPTPVSGGVVVSTNPFGDGSAQPRNNSVIGNHFGHNKPDIFWDESGSGNSFLGNLCDTSVPSSLCN